MNDSRCLLQEFHTLVNEYGGKLPMTTMYKDSLLRRIEAELTAPLPEGGTMEEAAAICDDLGCKWPADEKMSGIQAANMALAAQRCGIAIRMAAAKRRREPQEGSTNK